MGALLNGEVFKEFDENWCNFYLRGKLLVIFYRPGLQMAEPGKLVQ